MRTVNYTYERKQSLMAKNNYSQRVRPIIFFFISETTLFKIFRHICCIRSGCEIPFLESRSEKNAKQPVVGISFDLSSNSFDRHVQTALPVTSSSESATIGRIWEQIPSAIGSPGFWRRASRFSCPATRRCPAPSSRCIWRRRRAIFPCSCPCARRSSTPIR